MADDCDAKISVDFYNMYLIYIVDPSYANSTIVTRAYMSHVSRINCYTILFLSFFITSLIAYDQNNSLSCYDCRLAYSLYS